MSLYSIFCYAILLYYELTLKVLWRNTVGNYLIKLYSEEYRLLLLNEKHIQTIFSWNIQEKNFEYYTCRPLKLSKSYEEYANKTLMAISEGKQIIYVLVNRDDCYKCQARNVTF